MHTKEEKDCTPPKDKIHDLVLSELCWESHSAFHVWKNSARPLSGPIYDNRIRCKRAVKFHLNTCRAREELKRIQRRDEMFESNHSRHFQSNYKKKVSCKKLLSDGKVISDPDELVAVWESYFKSLATSKCSSNPQLMSSLQKLNVLEAETYRTCDPILGDSITVEAVEGAIRHLKPMRSGGADSLTPEHLKHCGSIFKKWLCQLFNHLLRLEQKCAVVIAAPVSSESMSTVDVGDVSLPVEQSVKCLGIYFSSNQSSKTSIEENLVRREEPSSLMVALAFSMACLILYLLAVFLSAVLSHLSSMGLRFGYSIHYCLNWYLSKLIWERRC